MELIKTHIFSLLVILFFIGSVQASGVDYPLPAWCDSDEDCMKFKAKCIRRECHCTAYLAYGDGRYQCDEWRVCSIKKILGSDPCILGQPASADNSYCLESGDGRGACKCDAGYFGNYKRPRCMKAAKQDGKYPCLADRNCPTYSQCYKNWCICPYELTGDGENCKPKDPEPCSSDKVCKAKQGKCIDGYCRCIGMFAGNGVYCREAFPCDNGVKCGKNAKCMIDPLFPYTPACVCDPGFWKTKEGKCIDCLVNRHCRKRHSICVEGECTCREGLVLGKTSCEFAPSKTCHTNANCPDREGRCIDGKCRCVGSYVGNGVYCKRAKSCSQKKCGSSGKCLIDPLVSTRRVCQCLPGFRYGKSGQCVECITNADCNHDENSAKCVKGQCKCKDELIKDGKKCKAAPIQVCRADFDCHAKAKCQQGKCVCQGWFIGNGKYCRASRPCAADASQCGSHGVCLLDPLLLKTPHCRCEKGYEFYDSKGKCAECLSDKDCNTDYSTCVEGECKCKDELLKQGKTCRHPRLHLCDNEFQNDCHKNAKCVMKRCYCQGHTTGNGLFCRNSLPCPKGHKCGKHSTCVVDPLFPKTPDCKCDPGYKNSSTGSCVEMSNCEKKGLDCPDGAKCGIVSGGSMGCICEKGYKTIFKNDELTCEDTDECATGKARCSGDRCTNTIGSYTCIPCPHGFTDGADGLCVGTFKESCNCKKNEECRRGKCKCKKGYKRSKHGQCVGGNRDELDVEFETSSGNCSQFSCHLSVLIALVLLGSLAFST